MKDKIASSKALGFGVFAILVWMMSMMQAGIAPHSFQISGHGAGVLLGVGLIVAGVVAFLRSEKWLAFFFILWSSVGFAGLGAVGNGWMWFGLTVVNLYLAFAAAAGGVGPAVGALTFLMAIDTIGQGLYSVAGLHWGGQIGAYIGYLVALLAFYVSAVDIMSPGSSET